MNIDKPEILRKNANSLPILFQYAEPFVPSADATTLKGISVSKYHTTKLFTESPTKPVSKMIQPPTNDANEQP